MGYVGISLILATAVVILVHPDFRRQFLGLFRPNRSLPGVSKKATLKPKAPDGPRTKEKGNKAGVPDDKSKVASPDNTPALEVDSDNQSTPKATPAHPSITIPAFTLDGPLNSHPVTPSFPPQPPVPSTMAPPPRPPPSSSRQSPLRSTHRLSSSLMSPPSAAPAPPRPPRLAQFPTANSSQRTSSPTPHRGPPGSSSVSGLVPPPSHNTPPSKPSRKVMLTPGHSPLDWARISGPHADLRGVLPATPYLKVTLTQLRTMTGRKGKDAWMALGGKVYNVTPYAEFHPGGVPELMRGAGRDATRLYGEVHPWVNYENMLQACLVGILVEEEGEEEAGGGMDGMD